MQIRLSEQPRDWRKFMLQVAGVAALWVWILVWRRVLEPRWWPVAMGALLLLSLVAWMRPQWFRGCYRVGMTVSGWLGDRVGRVLLTVFFFLLVTPLAWALRAGGYDPLARRRTPKRTSFWQTPMKTGKLDRMF